MAVFGWVVLHGLNFDAFLLAELQNGEDTSEFTDHPVLQRECERTVKDSVLTRGLKKTQKQGCYVHTGAKENLNDGGVNSDPAAFYSSYSG